jgi:hypothetical protein
MAKTAARKRITKAEAAASEIARGYKHLAEQIVAAVELLQEIGGHPNEDRKREIISYGAITTIEAAAQELLDGLRWDLGEPRFAPVAK